MLTVHCVYDQQVRILRMLVAQAVVFTLSWLPLYVIRLRILLGPPLSVTEKAILPDYVNPVFQWIGSANSCINPFIYCYFSQQFRAGISTVLRRTAGRLLGRCCCGERCNMALQQQEQGDKIGLSTTRRTVNHDRKLSADPTQLQPLKDYVDVGIHRQSMERIDYV